MTKDGELHGITYEKFIELIPEETKLFIYELIKKLDKYSEDPLTINNEKC